MPQKILIVDDEPNIVIPLQFLMEQNGYLTLVAQSGEEALESISKEKQIWFCWILCCRVLTDLRYVRS